MGSNEGTERKQNLSGVVVFVSLDEMFWEGRSEKWTFVLRVGMTTFPIEETVTQRKPRRKEIVKRLAGKWQSQGHNL